MSQVDDQYEMYSRGYRDVDGEICLSHISEPFILADLASLTVEGQCQICSAESSPAHPVVEFEAVQSIVMELITSNYRPESDGGSNWHEYQGPAGYEPRDLTYEICEDVFQVEFEDEIIELLAEAFVVEDWSPFDTVSDLEAAQFGWEQFVSDVGSESRFVFLPQFSLDNFGAPHRSASFLWSLLPYVDDKTHSYVTEIPAGTAFYRGRLVKDNWSTLSGAKELGPTTPEKASPNRMSPEGVPMFYGSATPETAIREIAAHGTREFARIGAFRNQRELKVLDLTKLAVLPSIFDKSQRRNHGIARFFKQFVQNVTAPVTPDRRPHLHYIPTQIVTEFFRWVPQTKIDGIKLPSAQDQSDTFVLFLTADQVGDIIVNDADNAPKESTKATKNNPSRLSFSFLDEPEIAPVLTLNPEEVHTYKVIRHINVERVEPGVPPSD